MLHSKLPVLRPPFGLLKSALISQVVLISNTISQEKYHLRLAKRGLNSEVVLILSGLNSEILLYVGSIILRLCHTFFFQAGMPITTLSSGTHLLEYLDLMILYVSGHNISFHRVLHQPTKTELQEQLSFSLFLFSAFSLPAL